MNRYLTYSIKRTFSVNSEYQRKGFNSLQTKDVQYFRSIMPKNTVIDDPNSIQPHNQCFIKMVKGNSSLLLCPQTTEQVSQILRHCNERRLAVVPQGGNTGLVGGSVPVFDEIILNLKNMNRIQKFDPISSVVSVESGVILEKLSQFLEQEGFETPLDLGAKGSCQVGGNASTNAGGKYVIKYGSFRSHILGLEAVLPSGEVLDMRSQILKDNTGYDLKQLFIGGEGTLGIITKLNIHCPKSDSVRKLMVFKTDKYQKILNSLPKLKALLGKNLNAMQYVNGVSYNGVIQKLHPPIFDSVSKNDHLLFVEASTQDLDDVFEQLDGFQEAIMSNSDKDFLNIWKIRQDVAVAAEKYGKMLCYDISFDVKEWQGMINELADTTKTDIFGFGHIGDGNLHLCIIPKEGEPFEDSFIFQRVAKKRGSISAEHGIGLQKPHHLHLQKSPQILNLYKQIKHIFDPNGIMNPYKYLPQ